MVNSKSTCKSILGFRPHSCYRSCYYETDRNIHVHCLKKHPRCFSYNSRKHCNGKLISSSYVILGLLTIFYSSRRRCVSCSVLLMLVSVNLCGLIWLLTQKKIMLLFGLAREMIICANITTSQGHCLPWTNEIRYLGTYIETVDNLGAP